MGIGGAAGAAGFILHGSHYSRGLEETDRAAYEWEQDANVAGFVLGVAGIAAAVTGFVLFVDPRARDSHVTLVPGPVTTATVRF